MQEKEWVAHLSSPGWPDSNPHRTAEYQSLTRDALALCNVTRELVV